MKHMSRKVFAPAVILKEGDDDHANLVQKAIDDLTKSIGDRIKALEEKGIDPKLITRLDDFEKKLNRPKGDDDKKEPSAERKAFANYLRLGNQTPIDDLKTLVVSSDPLGGYLAPPEVSSEFIRDLVQFSPIRQYASVRSTTAPSVKYPKRTAITNAHWVGETQTRTESEPGFGQLEVGIKELATYVDVSNQLLADSGGQAEAEVRLALADDFGQKEGVAFVSGNGVLAPEGIMTNASIGYVASGNASSLGATPADLLISLMYALPAMYRSRGVWLLNGTTLAAIRKLKDGQGNYLWQPSYQVGQPETILGRPVVEAVDMPDVGSGTEPIAFGDLGTGYRIVDRATMSVLVDPYTQAANGITRIHASRRVGAGVIQPAALKKVRCATS